MLKKKIKKAVYIFKYNSYSMFINLPIIFTMNKNRQTFTNYNTFEIIFV